MTESSFTAVKTVGALLPADLLSKLLTGTDIPGLAPVDYHLAAGETVREAANRSWTYLAGVWRSYRDLLAQLPEADRATTLTRERWLLILARELGFGRLPTTGAGGITADGKAFPISHIWEQVPVHLLGWRIELDTRTRGVAGAAEAPQSLVQECLNRSDAHLWAILSNGQLLRVLRDSTSLVGSAYVEFDLEAIFDGELFVDFMLLYLLCHQSRFEILTSEGGPADCWLERWRTLAIETGTRALNLLRDGVAEAIQILGSGFLGHPANTSLRDHLANGDLQLSDYHHSLMRLVYRLLFLFVAEDRGALLDPDADKQPQQRYFDYFSTARLRRVAARRRGGRHGDLWRGLTLVIDGLGREDGRPELALPALGGLFEPSPLDVLQPLELSNEALLGAIRCLSTVRDRSGGPSRAVDYRNLGAEELGSVYESLLEEISRRDPSANTFTLQRSAGNERKTTGSYYTPTSLIESLLDTALDPLLDDATKTDNPQEALLELTVCDPACGSGHFLVAAARRIAKRLATIQTGDPEPAPTAVTSALRQVVSRCVYGVDVNPMAAELAKVSLWIETIQAGQPLSFLDAQIKVGNSLLGVIPALLANGLPDTAFKPIEGDDKKWAAALARRNKAEREAANQEELFADTGLRISNARLARATQAIVETPQVSLADVHTTARRYRELEASPDLQRAREVADAWCAAFVWHKTDTAPPGVTQRLLEQLDHGDDPALAETRDEVARLAGQYRFFHWHLEFPHVFPVPAAPGLDTNPATGWDGGFSCILGNPPWDQIQFDPREFFAATRPDIAELANMTARNRAIKMLEAEEPYLYERYLVAMRLVDGIKHFVHDSGRYPLTSYGRLNSYSLFAENKRTLIHAKGRVGTILPTGISTDSFNQYFFRDLVEHGALASLYDFENSKPIFDGVHRSFKFCLLTLAGRATSEPAADFAFFTRDAADLTKPDARFSLTPDEISLLNPNTRTCPVFRSRRDAEIALGIYRRVPILLREGDPDGNPWGLTFMLMFMMNTDSHLFRTREQLETDGWTLHGNTFTRHGHRMLPLYQGMMTSFYDHRAADVVRSATATRRQNQPFYLSISDRQDPFRSSLPAYWVDEKDMPKGLPPWLIGFSDITSPTNERTFVPVVLPQAAVGNTFPLMLAQERDVALAGLVAACSSFVVDYCARQKIGGTHVNFFYVAQFPIISPSTYREHAPWQREAELRDWVADRVDELVYTAWDMQPFALGIGDDGPPFIWDEERRTLLRAELDAAYFHLYGIERDDVKYILDTFPIVRRKDEAAFGEYRTKRQILEIYDAMAKAIDTGTPYQAVLDPPPGFGARHPDR
jgi:N-6 DNA Methylase